MQKIPSPIVSVLTTCYNRENFLSEAIESALESTLTDIELIIVDDKSSDNSVEIARKYEKEDSRVRVFVNEVNLGDYPNRNKAASYARGKYLKYLDADDLIYPHCLDHMVSSMEKFPQAGLGLAMKGFYGPKPQYLNARTAIRTNYLDHQVFLSSPLSAIIRHDAFREVGGFSGKRYVGDTELWMKLAMHSGLLKLLPGYGYWRSHDDQESKNEAKDTAGSVARYRFEIDILNEVKSFFSEEELKLILGRTERNYARLFFRKLYGGNFKSASSIKKETGKSLPGLLSDAFKKVK